MLAHAWWFSVVGVTVARYSFKSTDSLSGVARYPGRLSKTPAMSVAPWMLEWPRIAFTPPPGRPTLPRRSCSVAAARIIWTQHSVGVQRSEEHTSELQSQSNLVCRLLLEKKKK